jgi:hypothetical protein
LDAIFPPAKGFPTDPTVVLTRILEAALHLEGVKSQRRVEMVLSALEGADRSGELTGNTVAVAKRIQSLGYKVKRKGLSPRSPKVKAELRSLLRDHENVFLAALAYLESVK